MLRGSKYWFGFGALAIGVGVGLAAWHAHGLAERLDADAFAAFGRALQHQFLAGVGLMLLGLGGGRLRALPALLAGIALVAGAVLFCGSIYLKTAGGVEAATAVAPLGGSLQIAGWLLLAAAAFAAPSQGWSRHPDSNRG